MRTTFLNLRQPASSSTGRTNLATSLTLAAMSLGYGVVQLDVTIVNTALNSIGASFGGGVTQLQWVVSTYTIAFAAFILTAGALGDRIGAKRVFIGGFAIFTAAGSGHLGRWCELCAHRRASRRRRIDYDRELAGDFSRQPADRYCRPVADLALCERDTAITKA
jgi:hypothetical protein